MASLPFVACRALLPGRWWTRVKIRIQSVLAHSRQFQGKNSHANFYGRIWTAIDRADVISTRKRLSPPSKSKTVKDVPFPVSSFALPNYGPFQPATQLTLHTRRTTRMSVLQNPRISTPLQVRTASNLFFDASTMACRRLPCVPLLSSSAHRLRLVRPAQ